ncbi:hypothetical protein [Phaffia rhodozyma]|uniref:Uncharacterized protein n=1 Tax=Phaffia rhodozyma TaxID=264483 RepID=A0A0F7SWS9_PHARH|nr:hypothetical protein [Phaffia rhodozyma]
MGFTPKQSSPSSSLDPSSTATLANPPSPKSSPAQRSTDQLSNLSTSASRSSTQLLRSKSGSTSFSLKKRNSIPKAGPSTWKRSQEGAGRRRVKTRPPFAYNEPDTPPESSTPLPQVPLSTSGEPTDSNISKRYPITSLPPSKTPRNHLSRSSSAEFVRRSSNLSPEDRTALRQEEDSVPPLFGFPLSTTNQRYSSEEPVFSSNSTGPLGLRRNTFNDAMFGVKHSRPVSLGAELAGLPESPLPPPSKLPGADRGEWWPFNPSRTKSHTRWATPFGGGGTKSYFPDTSDSIDLGLNEGRLEVGVPSPENDRPPNNLITSYDVDPLRNPDEGNESSPLPLLPPAVVTPHKSRKDPKPSFRIALPTPQPFLHSAHHSKTPGWSSPYAAPERLRRFSGTDMESGGSKGSNSKSWWERIQDYVLYNTWVPLVIRLFNFSLAVCTLALGIKIRALERAAGLPGVTGSSPLVAIIYSPITLIHVVLVVYVEYFGPPLGLWSLPSKILFTSFELIIISLWSSLLSLVISDLFTTSLFCVSTNLKWWTHLTQPIERNYAPGVCDHQIGLVVMVFVGVVGFLVGNVVSLGRIFAKVVKRSGYGGGGGGR